MSDVKFVFDKPHVCFDADAASLKGTVQGNLAPVVVMGMTRYGFDVSREVCWPV